MIQDWEHHELRRSRRDLYHLSHEVALREAHAARQAGTTGSAVAAFANLCHKVAWAGEVLRAGR